MSRPRFLLALGVAAVSFFAAPLSVTATTSPEGVVPEDGAGAAVKVTLSPGENGIVTPGRDLPLTVSVTNSSPEPLAATKIAIELTAEPLMTQDSLNDWGRVDLPSPPTTPLASSTGATIAPDGTSGPNMIVVHASQLPQQVTRSAVYGLSASVISAHNNKMVSTGRTVITIYPTIETPRVPVTVLAPLVTPSQTTGLISTTDLETYTSPSGLLTKQLGALAANPSVAIGIDPMIIASIRVLGAAAPPSATTWLSRLETVHNETFPLLYADSDIAAQAQSGRVTLAAPTSFDHVADGSTIQFPESKIPATRTPPLLSDPATTGSDPVKRFEQWNYTRTGIGWPRDNTVTAPDLRVFGASGIATTVLSSGNVAASKSVGELGSLAKIGETTALISDDTISGAVREAVAADSLPSWQTRIALANARISLLAAKQADQSLVITLDRPGSAVNTRLSETLANLTSGRSITPTALGATLATTPEPAYAIVDKPEKEDRLDTVRSLFSDEAQAQLFSTVVDKPVFITGSQRLSLLALLANSWATSPNWSDQVSTHRKSTEKLIQSVEIVPASTVNLVNSEGSIPVTVRNRSAYPVTITITATPSNSRLEVDNANFHPTHIDPDAQDTALIPVKARLGNGDVTLRLALLSPSKNPIGTPVSIPINVRAEWETVGTLIVGALLVTFFGLGVTRNITKRRRSRSTPLRSDATANTGG